MLSINLKDNLTHFQLKPFIDVSFNLSPLTNFGYSLNLSIFNVFVLIVTNSKDKLISSSYYSQSHKGTLIEIKEHSRIVLSLLNLIAVIRLCSTPKGFLALYINVEFNHLNFHWSFPKAWC